MNKRIKKKHAERFNLGLMGLSFCKLERVLGRGIDYKIKSSLINRRIREWHKEKRKIGVISDIGSVESHIDQFWKDDVNE